MLVAVGTCVFLLAGMTASDEGHRAEVVSRVIQGICAGIGFIGAGTILKLTDKLEVKGLTTASSIWTAAAVGTACGIHHYDLAILGTVFALIILFGFRLCERWLGPPLQEPTSAHDETGNESPQTHRQKKRKMQEGLDKRNRGQTP